MSELIRSPGAWLEENSLSLRRWLIVIFVLGLAPAVGYLASPGRVNLVLFALLLVVGGSIAAYAFLRWSALGLVLIIPTNMLVPFTIGTGGGSTINATILLIALLAALWLLQMVQDQQKLRLLNTRPHRPLLLFLIVACVAFLVGQLSWFNVSPAPLPAQIGGLGVFVISAVAFLLAGHQIEHMRWVKWMTWSLIGLGMIFPFLHIFPGMLRYSRYIYQYGSTSSQYWNWLVALAFGQALLNRKLKVPWRVLLALIVVVSLYAVAFHAAWKSGWLPPVVAIITIIALRRWWLGLALVLIGPVVFPSIMEQLIASDAYSYATRLEAWAILLEIMKANPVLGLGPSNYYYYTPLYSIRGYSVRFNSHNQYIDIVAQTGVVGLFFLFWFFIEIGRLGWQLREKVPEGFPRAHVYGVLGGLAGMVVSGMLGDWFLPFVYNVGIVGLRSSILGWLFLGTLVAMQHMVASGAFAEDGE